MFYCTAAILLVLLPVQSRPTNIWLANHSRHSQLLYGSVRPGDPSPAPSSLGLWGWLWWHHAPPPSTSGLRHQRPSRLPGESGGAVQLRGVEVRWPGPHWGWHHLPDTSPWQRLVWGIPQWQAGLLPSKLRPIMWLDWSSAPDSDVISCPLYVCLVTWLNETSACYCVFLLFLFIQSFTFGFFSRTRTRAGRSDPSLLL